MSKQRPPQDDWRRQGQEAFLKGRHMRFESYTPYRPGWDHDHCEFCGRKFSLSAPDLMAGYTTDDHYHWVCEDCFSDFCPEFKWTTG